MNKDNCISCKEYAKLMRENAVRNHNGDVICSFELWEHIASIIDGFEFYRNPKDVARKIFEEIEQEISAALKSNYKVMPQVIDSDELYHTVQGKISALSGIEGFIADLKKKYESEGEE